MITFNIANWFWIVAGEADRVWSSAARSFVPVADQTYVAWRNAGGHPTRIANFAELGDVLYQRAPDMVPSHPKNVQAALDQTDLVALRCFKSGAEFPEAWRDYTAALRGLVTSPVADPTAALPVRPAFPAGT